MSMFDFIFNFFQKINFGYNDIIDIVVVSFLIFLLLVLLKKTRALPVLFGIAFLGVIYGLSIVLKLHLTQTIFTTILGVSLIIVAIVFQKEIKRLFEIVGNISLRTPQSPLEEMIKTIVRAVNHFSENKVGALIVFAGRENIERHLGGGIVLDGRVSYPLLLSIFSSVTPGHDGAIIIEGDTIKKFGVHLPLSENSRVTRKYGTRHRAAIGISEYTDALSIVVSEEKGTISMTHNQKMYVIKSTGKLERELKGFLERKFPEKRGSFYNNWIKNNFKLLLSSFAFSVVFWTIFTYQTSIIQKKYTIPLEFNSLKEEYLVDTYTPQNINITFSGRESDFDLLKPGTIKASLDLSETVVGWKQITIEGGDVDHPSSLKIVKIEPASVRVNVKEIKKAKEKLGEANQEN